MLEKIGREVVRDVTSNKPSLPALVLKWGVLVLGVADVTVATYGLILVPLVLVLIAAATRPGVARRRAPRRERRAARGEATTRARAADLEVARALRSGGWRELTK